MRHVSGLTGGNRPMARTDTNFFSGSFGSFEPGLALAYVGIAVVSIADAGILIVTNGNLEAAIAFTTVLLVLFGTFYKVDWGFYMFFGMVLLFDQFLNQMPDGDPITLKVGYFMNLKQNPFLPSFSAGVMNPLELQMGLILLAWFIAISARRARKLQGVPFWGFAVLLFLAILAAELHGLHGGGDFLVSLWEIRALIYFLLLYFLVPQVIQTRKQITIVVWIFIIMVTIKALQGDMRLAGLGFKFDEYTVLTNHEDPMFMSDLFILAMGFSLFDAKVRQRKVLAWLMPLLIMGFYAGQRRASYAGYFIAVGVFVIMLSSKERKKFFRAALPVVLFLGLYTAVFWNYHGRISEPIELVKSGFSQTEQGAGERFDSNLYREFERYDLAATVKNFPVIGTGFGQKYQTPAFLVHLGISLQDWIPHDQIFWIMVNMGLIGFFIFFLFIDSLMFESGRVARITRDPYLRSLTFMIGAMIANQIVVSYYDMQLTFYRDMVFLGTFCGLLPVIRNLAKEERMNKDRAVAENPKETLQPEGVNP
jgi:O-Antigen ligase